MHPEILSISLFWFVTAYTPGPNNVVASYSGFNFGITKTIPHIHSGYEEFLILDGELVDSDGTKLKKGDFISYEPNSSHSSYTEKGCLILTFMRGHNKQID